MKYSKLLGSSVDPQKLSLTVKGVIVGAIPIIGVLVQLFGVSLSGELLNDLAESVGSLILQIGSTLSAIMITVGIIRKILVATGLVKAK